MLHKQASAFPDPIPLRRVCISCVLQVKSPYYSLVQLQPSDGVDRPEHGWSEMAEDIGGVYGAPGAETKGGHFWNSLVIEPSGSKLR